MSSNYRYRNCFLLLTSTLTVMAGATIAPALPGMLSAFSGYPNAEWLVKLLVTLPALVIVLLAPLVGWVVDKFHKKLVLIISVAIYGVAGGSGFLLSESLLAIFIGRLLLGVAVAGVMVSCGALIADYFSGPERAKYMGLMAAFGSFGGVVFMGLGSVLAGFSWQLPFTIYFAALLLLPFIWLFIAEPVIAQQPAIEAKVSVASRLPNQQADLQSPQQSPQQSLRQSPPAIKNSVLTLCCAFACIEVFALYMMPIHFPFYYSDVTNIAPIGGLPLAGIIITWMLLVMSLVSFNFAKLRRGFNYYQLQIAGLSLVALGYLFIAFKPVFSLCFFSATIAGVGLGIMRPNVVMWVMSAIPPAHRGKAMGAITSSVFIGQFISPLLTQPIVQMWGYSAVYVSVALLLFSIALVVAIGTTLVRRYTAKVGV